MVKTEYCSPEIRNSRRASTVTTPIQHHPECPSQCNRVSKINKRHIDYKGRNKTIYRWHDCLCRESQRTYKIATKLIKSEDKS